jgi:transcriptional regulator with XRE-family HTH domain
MPRLARSKAGTTSTSHPRGQLEDAQLKSIDCAVGAQVRMRRILLGMSQETVAKTMDLTFQQLQKYEHGTNRISGSRLFQLGSILHVPVSFFFETVDVGQVSDAPVEPEVADADSMPGDVMKKRRTVELVRAFYAIDGEKQRNAALTLLKTLGKSS